jgi:hypothetical protein
MVEFLMENGVVPSGYWSREWNNNFRLLKLQFISPNETLEEAPNYE